jgi:hypothetical protein
MTLIAFIVALPIGYWLGLSSSAVAIRVRLFVSRWWTPA